MKLNKKTMLVISIIVIGAFLFGGMAAYAAGNVSDLEQKWYDFQEALFKKGVDDGKMTQDRADERLAEIEEAINADENDAVSGPRGRRIDDSVRRNIAKRIMVGGFMREIDIEEILGLSMDEIKEKLETDGVTIRTIAEDLGKTEELKQAQIEAMETMLDKLENDTITQEQADERLEEFKEHLENGEFRPMIGDRGAPRGRNMPYGKDCDDA